MNKLFIKKSLFFLTLVICLTFMSITSWAADIEITITDATTWTVLEETVTEEQLTRQAGLPRLAGDVCLGWYNLGNVIQINDPIDFGQGLESGVAETASNLDKGTFQSTYPTFKFIIRADSKTGPVIAEIYPDSDAGTRIMATNAKFVVTSEGSKLTGKHAVFIEHAGGMDASGSAVIMNLGNISLKTKSVAATSANNNTSANTAVSVSPSALSTSPNSSITASASNSPNKTSAISSPKASTSASAKGSDEGGSNITGLVIGIIVGVLVVGGVIVYVILRNKKK